MAENIDGTTLGSGLYNTKIPAYEDPADIQAALKLYHYGDLSYDGSNQEPSNIPTVSIAGHLKKLQDNIDAIESLSVHSLQASENLNDYIDTGFYNQTSNTDARSGTNYPTYNGLAYAGMLTVTSNAGFIYQVYHLNGDGSVTNPNLYFWRAKSSTGNFTSWKQASDTTHSHAYADITGLTTALAAKQDTITTATTTQIGYLGNSTGTTGTNTTKLVFSDSPTFSGTVTIPTLSLTNALSVANGGTGGTTKVTGRSGLGIIVQQSEPTLSSHPSLADGDIWLW